MDDKASLIFTVFTMPHSMVGKEPWKDLLLLYSGNYWYFFSTICQAAEGTFYVAVYKSKKETAALSWNSELKEKYFEHFSPRKTGDSSFTSHN